MKRIFTIGLCLAVLSCTPVYDVVVAGGGTGGTAAAIEAARGGARTLVVESTPWLGGMLTGAGVSAIDGNYRRPLRRLRGPEIGLGVQHPIQPGRRRANPPPYGRRGRRGSPHGIDCR